MSIIWLMLTEEALELFEAIEEESQVYFCEDGNSEDIKSCKFNLYNVMEEKIQEFIEDSEASRAEVREKKAEVFKAAAELIECGCISGDNFRSMYVTPSYYNWKVKKETEAARKYFESQQKTAKAES